MTGNKLIQALQKVGKIKLEQEVYIRQENGFTIDIASVRIDHEGDIIICVEGAEPSK